MEVIEPYFPELSPAQKAHFESLSSLYTDWNSKINVISRKDIDALQERHVLHSLGIAKVHEFAAGERILDVGTGGGFPGIPLAILFPETQFHLIDSIGKKIKVVNGVAQALGLKNVTAEQIRAEQVSGKFDCIVSRAVTRLSPFYTWVKTKIKREAGKPQILALKGGDLNEEIDEFLTRYAKRKVSVAHLADHFKEDFFETKKIVVVK